MSEDQKYPVEILKTKTVDELIEIIFSLQEEIAMLDFLINEYEEIFESLEIRVTSRLNLVKKNDGLYTYWLGGGISFGYEF